MLIPVDCRDARGKSGIDYKSDFVDPFDKSGSNPNCWYKIDALRRLYPEYNDLSDDVLSTALSARSIKEPAAPWKRWELLFSLPLAFRYSCCSWVRHLLG